jgi:SAM-dependent methyltransferase
VSNVGEVTDAELIAAWAREEQQPFTGWDFSHLAGRMHQEQAPWSYAARAATLLSASTSALDLGTGGGEYLLELRSHWPERLTVTEEYPPNVRLVTERLAPLGVHVVRARLTDDGPLPFASGEFGLVLDRHSAFNPAEVARVLGPDGTFLTQQVHRRSAEDLLTTFGARPQWPNATSARYVPRLGAAGLDIVDVREWTGRLWFADVGAIVYYLKVVPWLVPGFSVESYAQTLLRLEQRRRDGEELAYTARGYLIEAHKRTALP